MNKIKVAYVGKKPFAIDNVAGSGVMWNGNGDVQEVTAAQARILTKYKDQWALVDLADAAAVAEPPADIVVEEGGEDVSVPVEALAKPFEKMNKAELIALAKEKWGKEMPDSLSKKNMIDQVTEWQNELG